MGRAAWGTDYPASEFFRRLRTPPTALNGVLLVIVVGYSVANGFQLPLPPEAWRTIYRRSAPQGFWEEQSAGQPTWRQEGRGSILP